MAWIDYFKNKKTPAPPPRVETKHAPVGFRLASDPLLYPPEDPGIPLMDVDALLESQGKILSRLKVHAAAEEQQFDDRYMKPIGRLARHISVLPASTDEIYSGPGGLLRACVELGFASFQAADGRIFTGALGVEQRFLLEVRWRYVCFLAGLLWPLGKTLESIKVTSESGEAWPARVTPILEWAQSNSCRRVHCTWPKGGVNPGPASTSSALALSIAGDRALTWLEAGSPSMTTAFIGIASGVRSDDYGIAFDLVADMWQRVRAVEQARRPQTYGRVQYGHHLGPHLVDAMRGLLDRGVWSINTPPLLVDATGVYLVWPSAGEDLLKQLQSGPLKSMTNTVAGLLNLLETAELIKHDAQLGPFIDVADADGEIREAVLLVRPTTLIDGYTPKAFEKARPISMAAIESADPLAHATKPLTSTARASAPPGKVAASVPKRPEPPAPGPDLLASTLTAQTTAVSPPRAEPDAASKSVAKIPTSAVGDEPDAATAEEAHVESSASKDAVAEVRYADSLPKDIRKQFKGFQAEQLGKLLAHLRDTKDESVVRKLPTGLAVDMNVLRELIPSPPDFLMALSAVGMLHIDPSTPGRRIHEVLIPEGSTNKRRCFILSTVLTERLGI